MKRYQSTDTEDEPGSSHTRRTYTHFDDDHYRSRFQRSRSRTSPTPERYDPQLRQMPQEMRDRSSTYARPHWLGQNDMARRHRPHAATHTVTPPPGLDTDIREPPPRASSRPPLQAPTAQPIAKSVQSMPRTIRQHSTSPHGPNKSPRLDSQHRKGHSDTARGSTDEYQNPDVPMITERQAAAAARPKSADSSHGQRSLLRTTSRGSASSGSPTSKETPRHQQPRAPRETTRRNIDKPTYLGKEWKQDKHANYRLQRPGQSPLRPYAGYDGGSSQSEEIMFRRPGKAARSVYMEEVECTTSNDEKSYFAHRKQRRDDTTARSRSLNTKSSSSQRPTWKPKPPKETTRDKSPTEPQPDDIEEV